MPKHPGRPRVDPENQPATVHLLLPAQQFDVIQRCAKKQDLSVPEVIRRVLRARRDRLEDEEE